METSLCSCFAKRIGHFFHLDGSIGHPPLLKRSLERPLTRRCQGPAALEEWVGLVLPGSIQRKAPLGSHLFSSSYLHLDLVASSCYWGPFAFQILTSGSARCSDSEAVDALHSHRDEPRKTWFNRDTADDWTRGNSTNEAYEEYEERIGSIQSDNTTAFSGGI